MGKYYIIYDYDNGVLGYGDDYVEEKNLHEEFVGSWSELQDHIKSMKQDGCYNIDVCGYDAC